MEDIMKIAKSLEESVLLIKGASETIVKTVKNEKDRFFGILLDKLEATLLGNL